MGRDKARLLIGGEPLWRRQLAVLQGAGADPVFLVQARGQRALTRGVVRDTRREAGPLAGIHAALARCPDGHLAVLAVDLPYIEPGWFSRLAGLCAPGIGAVARTRHGYEPLAAIYPRTALAEAESRLARGAHTLQEFVTALVRSRRMRVLRLKAAEQWPLQNWNTPADLAVGAPVRN